MIYNDVLKEFTNHFRGSGKKKEKTVFIDNNKQIYYKLAIPGPEKEPRVEFWIDTYAVQRDVLQKELVALFSRPELKRDYCLTAHYSARGVCCRRPFVTLEEMQSDVANLRTLLHDIENRCQISNVGGNISVGIGSVNVLDLFAWNLVIPDYQRSYCWGRENIVGLLEDLWHWQQKQASGEKTFRIGTIILKDRGNGCFDVIDGQQRIITLMLLALSLGQMKNGNTIQLGTSNQTGRAKGNIKTANRVVKEWIEAHNDEFEYNARKLVLNLNQVMVGVVVIGNNESEDLAFNFFNHLNSSGVLLTDYELLKGHHLRYLKDDSVAETMSARWRAIDGVRNEGRKELLLHKCLFRIRKWLAMEAFPVNADRLETHDLFREYSLSFEPVNGLCTSYKPTEIDSLLSGGIEFFDYVDHFRRLFESFTELAAVHVVAPLRCHSNGTLYDGILALMFMFYCKFGDVYLNEAAYAIAWSVSRIRNEWRVQRDYIGNGKQREFRRIAGTIQRATHEGEVLGFILNRLSIYTIENKGRTAVDYWRELRNVAERLQGVGSKLAVAKLDFVASLTKGL